MHRGVGVHISHDALLHKSTCVCLDVLVCNCKLLSTRFHVSGMQQLCSAAKLVCVVCLVHAVYSRALST